MGAKSDKKSIKNCLNNQCVNLLVKNAKNASKSDPEGAQGPTMSGGFVGPECREEVRSSSRRLQAQGSLLANHHHKNNHPANN